MIRLIYNVLVDTPQLDKALKNSKIAIQGISTVEDVPPAKIIDKNGDEMDDPNSPVAQTIVYVNDKTTEEDKRAIDEHVKVYSRVPDAAIEILAETIVDEKRELT